MQCHLLWQPADPDNNADIAHGRQQGLGDFVPQDQVTRVALVTHQEHGLVTWLQTAAGELFQACISLLLVLAVLTRCKPTAELSCRSLLYLHAACFPADNTALDGRTGIVS